MENQPPIKKEPVFRLRILILILLLIIFFIGGYIGSVYITTLDAEYPHYRLCSSEDKCSNYCPATAPLYKCELKSSDPSEQRSNIEQWLAGDKSVIDVINPNQKYCSCWWTGYK